MQSRLISVTSWLIAVFLIIFLTISLGVGIWVWHSFNEPMLESTHTVVIIPRKSSLEKVSILLEQNKVIRSAFQFKWIVRLKGLAPQIKSGEFLFPAKNSAADVMKILQDGKTVQHFVTFPEGLTSKEMMNLLNKAPLLEKQIIEIPAEGTLFPETYAYSYGDSRSSIVRRMQQAMEFNLLQLWDDRQSDLPVKTSQEALVLASIVEKETALAQEYARIAAVFINRLKIKMPLQSDPTVIYALEMLQNRPLERDLTTTDLQINHPYNTYKIAALPPGAICNPGKSSLKAVMHPATSKDLFFVADGSGGHAFSENLQQHQKKHQEWRLIRKKMLLKKPK